MYGTIAGWRAYATARGNSAPTEATDELATAALNRASDYIRFRYVANLLPAYSDLTFTPSGYDLPLVEESAYLAASVELAKPGFFTKSYTMADRKVLTEAKGIKWTVVGDAKGTYANMPALTSIEALFEPYIVDRDAPGFLFMSVGAKTNSCG